MMIEWMIFAAYLAGFLASWRSFAMSYLTDLENIGPHLPLLADDRAMAAFYATITALVWPVALPLRAAWRRIKGGTLLRTPKELAAAERAELQKLRALARKYDLPMGDR